ncbi:MAG: glycosyltransferase family 39 protein [bacterium]
MPFKSKISPSRHVALWILLFIIISSLAVRSYHLTSRSLWFDEAFSWRLIQFSNTEMLTRAAADVHPPLYYLVLKAWSFIFGSTLLSLRSFSVVAALLTIAASYLFTTYATSSRKVGLAAALLLTVSGFQIQYAQEARMYTLGTALLLLSSYLLLKAVRESSLKYWLAYAVTASALIYTHYFALFSLAGHFVFLFGYIVHRTKGRLGEILSWRQVWHALLAAFLILVFFLPWLPTFLKQNAQVQQNYWIPPIGGWSVPDSFYRMFVPTVTIPIHTGLGWLLLAAAPIFLTIIGWILLVKKPEGWLVMLSGFIPFFITIILSFTSQSLYQDRFFIFAHVFIVIGLAMLIFRLRPAWLKYLVLSLITVVLIITSYYYWLELDIPNKPGAHAATSYIFENRQADEPIIVSSPFVFFAIDHYAQENFNTGAVTHLYSETEELLHFAGGPILSAEDLVSSEIFKSDTDTIWIVDTTGFGESSLIPPSPWQPNLTQTYPEVFPYQGEVLVTRYSR